MQHDNVFVFSRKNSLRRRNSIFKLYISEMLYYQWIRVESISIEWGLNLAFSIPFYNFESIDKIHFYFYFHFVWFRLRSYKHSINFDLNESWKNTFFFCGGLLIYFTRFWIEGYILWHVFVFYSEWFNKKN